MKIYVQELGSAIKVPFSVRVHKIVPDVCYRGDYAVLVSRAKGKRYPGFLRSCERIKGRKQSWISIDYFTP